MAAGDVIVINENTFAMKGNYFDGVDDYVLHDAHAIARVAANDTVGTYTAWIYLDDEGTERVILSAGDNSSTNEHLSFRILNDGRLAGKLLHGGTTQWEVRTTSAVTIPVRKWLHVAVVQDGVQPILYIKGVVPVQSNATATDLTFWYDELTLVDKFAIGVLETNNTHLNDFKGAIGQVKYWNVALTAEEILQDKQGTAVQAANLQFNITMEDDGTTDSGLGADNGTLTGDAHYGGYISAYSQTLENNVTGHAAEDMNTIDKGNGFYETIIKRGD